jgi:hypothetical protein
MTKPAMHLSAMAFVLALMGPLPAHARLLLVTEGEIQSFGYRSMVVGDLAFPLSSTVKVFSADHKPMRLQELKPGDTVEIEIHEVAGKRFIDRVTLMPRKSLK